MISIGVVAGTTFENFASHGDPSTKLRFRARDIGLWWRHRFLMRAPVSAPIRRRRGTPQAAAAPSRRGQDGGMAPPPATRRRRRPCVAGLFRVAVVQASGDVPKPRRPRRTTAWSRGDLQTMARSTWRAPCALGWQLAAARRGVEPGLDGEPHAQIDAQVGAAKRGQQLVAQPGEPVGCGTRRRHGSRPAPVSLRRGSRASGAGLRRSGPRAP